MMATQKTIGSFPTFATRQIPTTIVDDNGDYPLAKSMAIRLQKATNDLKDYMADKNLSNLTELQKNNYIEISDSTVVNWVDRNLNFTGYTQTNLPNNITNVTQTSFGNNAMNIFYSPSSNASGNKENFAIGLRIKPFDTTAASVNVKQYLFNESNLLNTPVATYLHSSQRGTSTDPEKFYYNTFDKVKDAIASNEFIYVESYNYFGWNGTVASTSPGDYVNKCSLFFNCNVDVPQVANGSYNNEKVTLQNAIIANNVIEWLRFGGSFYGDLFNPGLLKGIVKPEEFVGWRASNDYGAIIKKEALIRYFNILGIPFLIKEGDEAITIEDFTPDYSTWGGYDPNYEYEDPDGPPKGQPDNEAGGGDGTGDNTEDQFELPTPTINPASAAVNQYVLNSNQVYNFMEELYNGTFWTNIDLLSKNPKESVVSLTAWPINLLNWDLNHVGLSQPIQCGNVTMTYASGQPIQNGYNKVLDIGEYEIKPYFGSFMDYLTKIELFMPFIGWRQLSTQNVMGRTIKIKYVLNFEDGGIVVYITSTDGKIERLEQVEQAKLAFDLPVFTSNMNEKEKDKLQLLMTAAITAVTAGVGAFGSGAGGVASAAGTAAGKEVVSGASKIAAWQDHINGGSVVASNASWYLPNKCILKFTRPRKSEASGYVKVHGYPANYTAKLGDVTGYTEVDNPVINGIECTDIERQKIKTLLQGGIYL